MRTNTNNLSTCIWCNHELHFTHAQSICTRPSPQVKEIDSLGMGPTHEVLVEGGYTTHV